MLSFMSMSFAVSALAGRAIAAPQPPGGLYSLTQRQDVLIRFKSDGSNVTVGKVDLTQFNPIATELSTIVEKAATMYVLALNKTGVNTSIIGISLADASITGIYPTPLLQGSSQIGLGMTIDAYGRNGLLISGIDRTSHKHTAYTVDPANGHTVHKLSDGFLAGALNMLDAPHCVDVNSGALWLTTPSKNYSVTGLFDLVSIDLAKGTERARHTLPSAQMVHAIKHDPLAGGLVALGLDAALKPFVFTIDTSTFKPTIVAGFDAYSVFNGIAAWDPLRRMIYGMAQVSETVRDPVLVGYSLHDQTKLIADICLYGSACAAPFNLDFFPGALE